MGTPAHAPFRLHPAIVCAIIGVCLAVTACMVAQVIPLIVAGQAYLLIVVLLAFRYWPPMFRWVASMPVPHRVVFGLLIGSMIIGHFTLNARTYFPYVAWEIFPFVREDDPVTCREMIGITASGKKVRLLAEQLFPSIVQFNLPGDDRPVTLEHLVLVLAAAYNKNHINDPIRRVDLVAMAVKLHPPATELRTQPSCELLKRYEISSGQ